MPREINIPQKGGINISSKNPNVPHGKSDELRHISNISSDVARMLESFNKQLESQQDDADIAQNELNLEKTRSDIQLEIENEENLDNPQRWVEIADRKITELNNSVDGLNLNKNAKNKIQKRNALQSEKILTSIAANAQREGIKRNDKTIKQAALVAANNDDTENAMEIISGLSDADEAVDFQNKLMEEIFERNIKSDIAQAVVDNDIEMLKAIKDNLEKENSYSNEYGELLKNKKITMSASIDTAVKKMAINSNKVVNDILLDLHIGDLNPELHDKLEASRNEMNTKKVDLIFDIIAEKEEGVNTEDSDVYKNIYSDIKNTSKDGVGYKVGEYISGLFGGDGIQKEDARTSAVMDRINNENLTRKAKMNLMHELLKEQMLGLSDGKMDGEEISDKEIKIRSALIQKTNNLLVIADKGRRTKREVLINSIVSEYSGLLDKIKTDLKKDKLKDVTVEDYINDFLDSSINEKYKFIQKTTLSELFSGKIK